jgi:hypothetical protein
VIAGVGQCPLALPCRSFKLLLAHFDRLRPKLVLDPNLLEPFTRCVVVVLRCLSCERKRSPRNSLYGLNNFGRKPGEGGRVALRERQDGHVWSSAADGVHCIAPNGMK